MTTTIVFDSDHFLTIDGSPEDNGLLRERGPLLPVYIDGDLRYLNTTLIREIIPNE